MSTPTLAGTQDRVRLFLTEGLMADVDHGVWQQARNTLDTPGVEHVCLMPDCHHGYGAPVGSVVVSADRVLPGPIGYDIGCGMAFYPTDVPASVLADHGPRRRVIDAIDRGIAAGEGRRATHGVKLTDELLMDVLNKGAHALTGRHVIPASWAARCERAMHPIAARGGGMHSRAPICGPRPEAAFGQGALSLDELPPQALRGFEQLGTLGGGNHFIELQEVRLPADPALAAIARAWGLFDGQLGVMVHSGSRGFGHGIGTWAFNAFKRANDAAGERYADRELVHAPVGTDLARRYFRLMAAGANFALANRLLMAKVVKQAVEAALPGAQVGLLYEISHNLAQWEPDETGALKLVHRKGTTRALPAGHAMLDGTMWAATGHPVITPGSMGDWSAIQVGLPGAAASFWSINHGAGRKLSRGAAKQLLDQGAVDAELAALDVLLNASQAPIDEAPGAYKPMDAVIAAVQAFGLAAVVAKCRPIGSLKGSDEPAKPRASAR